MFTTTTVNAGVTMGLDSDEVYDATEEWEVYEKGKVVECRCGQDIGVEMDVEGVTCATCGALVLDTDYEERSYSPQSGLERFM